MLTAGMLRALDLLLKSKDGAIAVEGLEAWIDHTRISRRTADGLLSHMAVTTDNRTGTGFMRYTPTTNARQILKRPALADEMMMRVWSGKPFSVTDDGKIVDLE